MSGIDTAFESLFFGAGAWLGLLLMLTIILGLSVKFKYGGFILLPVIFMLEVEHYTRITDSGVHAWIMIIYLFLAVFVIANMMTGFKR